MAPKDFRDFQDILTDLDDGRVHEQLTQKLRDVVAGCRDAQQAGSITLKINIKPDGRQFVVVPKVTTQIPIAKPGITMFFADEDGDLRKDDPKQVPLRHLQTPPQSLRTIEAQKGE